MHHFLREASQRREFQQPLGQPTTDLHRARQRRNKLDEVGIEEGASDFEGVRHRETIYKGQDLIGKDAVPLRFEHAVQWVAAGQVVEGAPHVFGR